MNNWASAMGSHQLHWGALALRDGYATCLLVVGGVLLVWACYCLCKVPVTSFIPPDREPED
jgi:hypothetical protein